MIPNLRDLGGIPAADGRRVKNKLFLRSATLSLSEPGDLQALATDRNMRRIYDLRTQREASDHPDPTCEGVAYIPFPLAAETSVGLSRSSAYSLVLRMAKAETKEEMYAMVPDMADVYAKMLRDDFSRAQFQKLLRELLVPDHLASGASLYHCSSGKDRTGMTSAAILLVLGASEADIMADYMQSLPFGQKDAESVYRQCLDGFHDEHAAFLVSELCLVKERYLQAFFDELYAQFGSLDAFIRDYVGLSQTELETVRALALA